MSASLKQTSNVNTDVLAGRNTRLILFHKHAVSANMHFLYFPYGGVCAFEPLPKLASLVDNPQQASDDVFAVHPTMIKHRGEEQLNLSSASLYVETSFCEKVEVSHGVITVYLAGFNGDDLPNITSADTRARFVTLMECVGIPPVEMLLLRRAYGVIMGGQS